MSNEELWNSGVGEEGLKFFPGWLTEDDADRAFKAVDGDTFPWNLKPKLYGTSIPQHAFHYQRSKKNEMTSGLIALETLCLRLAAEFDCKIEHVYCNRFQDPTHKIDWHQDQYASHICVLSLGGHRGLEFRDNKTKAVTRYDPKAGDLYFMSLQHNKLHHHRVLSGEESGDTGSTRISFVFFISAPFKKKEYQVGIGSSLAGAWNTLWS